MTDNPYALRPEAGPIPYGSLNRSQRAGLEAIAAALSQAVGDATARQPSEPEDEESAVDTNRASRLFFVSGEPGSGKSSLYTTLRYVTAPTTVRADHQYEDIRKGYSQLPNVVSLRGAIRWLEPIDLEVAVDEGENLLAAVLVRVVEAIDRSSLTASKACREAMDRLDELANDIGIAWDGNLRDRAASLDPDNYSQETLRVQQAKLSTNRRLRSALEALLKNDCYGLSKEALFVLPVDDFYLKPKASLELLRLLRMISVPRLFFLIMGDIKTVEALFFEKALADWTAVAGPEVLATLRERTTQEVLPRAREMKARYLRKLIPAGQRATINWTEWDQALGSAPTPRPTAAGSGSAERLRDLLSEVPIAWENGPDDPGRSLLNYLVSPLLTGDSALPDLDNKKQDTVNKFREAYSGLQVLDATPREILDLWIQLQKSFRERSQSDGNRNEEHYLRMLVEYAVHAIEEQDFLTEEDQEILQFAFPGSDRDDLQLGTDKLRLTQKPNPWPYGPDKDVFTRGHLDWRLSILDSESQACKCQSGRKEERALPPRKAAWIILLHDLAWNWKRSSVLENLVQRLLLRIGESSNQIESTRDLYTMHPGWAWYREKDGKKKGHWVHFPLPKVDTFRQLDRFLAIWSYGPSVTRRQAGRPPVEPLAAAQKWAMAAWIAEKGKEDLYAMYVRLLGENRKPDDSAKWYEECALSLDESRGLDGIAEQDSFQKFRARLFPKDSVLWSWATGSRK